MISKNLTLVQRFFLKNAKSILWVNLLLSFAIGFLVRSHLAKIESEKTQARYEKLIRDFHLAFEQNLHPLEGILSTLHYSKLNLTPENFRIAAESRNLFKNFEAALGFGFVRKVRAEELSTFLAAQKKIRKSFSLKRLRVDTDLIPSEEYFITEVIEPTEKTFEAIGVVFSDDPFHREAAINAMVEGRGQITQAIPLVESQNKDLGFVYFLPVYKTAFVPSTVDERRKLLWGWAYTPLVASKVIQFVKNQNPEALPFQIQEIDQEKSSAVLFESENYKAFVSQGLPSLQKEVNMAGQTWRISSVYTPHSYADIEIKSVLVGLILSVGSLLFYYYSRLLQKKLQFDAQLILKSREEVQKATHELSEQKAFLQMVIDSLPAIVGYWDKNLENKLNNKMFRDFFGVSARQIPYMNEVVSGKEQQLERPYLNRQGERRILLTKYHPHQVNGHVEGLTVIGIDITDIRRLEDKNKESEALLLAKAKLSLLGEMACGIAHEINNPLAVVLGKSEMAKSTLESQNQDFSGKQKMISDLEMIRKTALRMSVIVKGLRSFARDSEEDPYQNADLKSMVDNVLALIQERIKKNEVSIELINLNKDQLVFCNRTQIEQVFMNLIANSIDAIADSPEKWIKIEAGEVDQRWQIRFSDSGFGISADVVEKMTNAFFTTKEVGKGTGLGLSISKNILDKHHAHFEYQLYQGHTSFVIRFAQGNLKSGDFS